MFLTYLFQGKTPALFFDHRHGLHLATTFYFQPVSAFGQTLWQFYFVIACIPADTRIDPAAQRIEQLDIARTLAVAVLESDFVFRRIGESKNIVAAWGIDGDDFGVRKGAIKIYLLQAVVVDTCAGRMVREGIVVRFGCGTGSI